MPSPFGGALSRVHKRRGRSTLAELIWPPLAPGRTAAGSGRGLREASGSPTGRASSCAIVA
eukprot:7164656-Pyramimonas_sp.AAC.1